jgi:hypothetical protein
LLQFLDRAELEALIAALHQVAQRELPLTLTGAGLPQLPALTGAAKSYAERLFRFPTIDRLDEQAARAALELPAQAEGVAYEPPATDRILTLSEGYPYFLQEYGKHVWNAAAGPYRSGEIATAVGRPGPESVAPTRARLIAKGLLYSPAYGLNEFTVPHFDAYIRRSFPPEQAAPSRRR